MNRYARTTLILTLWWSAVAAIYAEMLSPMARLARPDLDVNAALVASWVGWLVWVPLSLIFIAAAGRRPMERGYLISSFATAGACLLLAIFVRAVFVYFVNEAVPVWYADRPAFPNVLQDSARNNFILAGLVYGTAHAVHYARAHAESRVQIALLESGLARARLDALSAQLNPHFLFNTLNSIAETVHHDAKVADAMIVSLSSLLRQSLNRGSEYLIPLCDELELLNHYLILQRLRLGTRLVTEVTVTPDCMTALVPPLLLQPLAENAIVHGIGRRLQGGRICLDVKTANGQLWYNLTSDGPLLDPSGDANGVGLENVRQRLQTIFVDCTQLRIEAVDNKQTRVLMSHPHMLKSPL